MWLVHKSRTINWTHVGEWRGEIHLCGPEETEERGCPWEVTLNEWVISLFVEGLIPLNDVCTPTDQCEDEHADCLGDVCLCIQSYYEKNGVCGKFMVMFFWSKLRWSSMLSLGKSYSIFILYTTMWEISILVKLKGYLY